MCQAAICSWCSEEISRGGVQLGGERMHSECYEDYCKDQEAEIAAEEAALAEALDDQAWLDERTEMQTQAWLDDLNQAYHDVPNMEHDEYMDGYTYEQFWGPLA